MEGPRIRLAFSLLSDGIAISVPHREPVQGAEALGIRALRIERKGRDPDPERHPVNGDLRALLQLV